MCCKIIDNNLSCHSFFLPVFSILSYPCYSPCALWLQNQKEPKNNEIIKMFGSEETIFQ